MHIVNFSTLYPLQKHTTIGLQIYHYMESCVPPEYHEFFMEISQTAMFDEYIRGKVVGAFKNVEIVESKNGFMLIHRKKSLSAAAAAVAVLVATSKGSKAKRLQQDQSQPTLSTSLTPQQPQATATYYPGKFPNIAYHILLEK